MNNILFVPISIPLEHLLGKKKKSIKGNISLSLINFSKLFLLNGLYFFFKFLDSCHIFLDLSFLKMKSIKLMPILVP